jgi:hypothetical protein
MVEYIDGPLDPAAARRKIDRPGHPHRVFDVTEGGYNLDELTEEFRLDDPARRSGRGRRPDS